MIPFGNAKVHTIRTIRFGLNITQYIVLVGTISYMRLALFLQLWHQNIQDIGVCEDTICSDDDFQIPDIDLTFRNFEEQFGADPEPIADSNNVFFVSSLDKSHEV